ncbi:recombinase family protein [Atlantibacter hermannii]|uniref:recombinase family protein n=1 Tax=Atlantibacter hermannii TaxID=565 RepID=UPI0028AF4FBF|nr:recombinase family protein [Atlantibacter hermannii]
MANIGYIRVSSIQQQTERQLAGVQLDKVFEEKISGKDLNRPALQEMLTYVREGDTIHCHDLTRLGRSTIDVLTLVDELAKRGVSVHFHKENLVTGSGNAMSEMILTIFAAVATAERKMLLERQAEGYAAAKAAGRIPGRGKGKSVDRDGITEALKAGGSINGVAEQFNVGRSTVQRIKAELQNV